MILDSLSNAKTYLNLGAPFQEAFDYLAAFDAATPDGRYAIDGDRLYALVQTYQPAPAAERTFESHVHHGDIQYLLSGQETIYYGLSDAMTPKSSYDPERDVTFYEDSTVERPLNLQAGDFVVLWPQDAHKPGCFWNSADIVRKVVIKMRLSSP